MPSLSQPGAHSKMTSSAASHPGVDCVNSDALPAWESRGEIGLRKGTWKSWPWVAFGTATHQISLHEQLVTARGVISVYVR